MADISQYFRQNLDFWKSAIKPALVFECAWGEDYLSYPACLFALAGITSVVEQMERVEPRVLSRKYVLPLALLGRNEKVIKAAIRSSKRRNVDKTSKGPSPLSFAVALGRADWVEAIIDKGANVNFVPVDEFGMDEERFTALYLATQRADRQMMQILLAAGADPWARCMDMDEETFDKGHDTTAVHLTAREGGARASELLSILLRGAATDRPGKPLNTVDHRGRSTLSYAAQHGYKTLMQVLVDFGAEWDDPADNEGMTPLEYAFQSGVAYTDQLWPSDGPNPSASLPSGESLPLQRAVVTNDSLSVQTLLSSGVNVTATNVYSSTALHEAIRRNKLDVLRYLLDWKDGQGQTMLMHDLRRSTHMAWAPLAGKCEWAIRKILHNTDYDFNTQDNDGVNVLMMAVSQQRYKIVEMLTAHERVNLQLSNHSGQTPRMIAEVLGSSDCSKEIRRCLTKWASCPSCRMWKSQPRC